jgi:pyruvate,water dikinase
MPISDATPQVDPALLFEEWNDGLAPKAFFVLDAMHFPYPLTPLSLDVYATAWADGVTTGLRELGLPVRRWHVIGRNHYRFDWQEMAEITDDGAIEATLRREMSDLLRRWDVDHLPAIQADLDKLERLTSQVATAQDIPALIDEALATYRDLWRIHFLIAIPMITAMQVFDEFYVDLFGGTLEEGHPLLAGQLNESVKASFGLSDLASMARELGVDGTILDHETDESLAALADSSAGQALLAALESYLDTYGLRQDLFDLATPTWRERPDYALMNVRNYLTTGLDARLHHAEVMSAAEAARQQARMTLASYPEPVRRQFEALVAMAQAGSFLQEEHNHHIDQVGLARLRFFFLAVGARLVETGVLDTPADVFFLAIEQINKAVEAPGPLQNVVQTQRRELDLAKSLTPPPFIGTPPPGPPPAASPFERSMPRFFGQRPPQSEDPNLVIGSPGARGTATGPARVVRTLEEAGDLQPGEILVTVTTMPPWSPLFAVAAGVVTETGGPLSHCAIVAREYDIPAVVGAARAMQRIVDGQVITIDGSTGIVDLRG